MPSYDPDRDGGTNDGATLRRIDDKIVIDPVTYRLEPVCQAARGGWRRLAVAGAAAGRRDGRAGGWQRPVARAGRSLMPMPMSHADSYLCRRFNDYQQVSELRTILRAVP